MWPCCNDSVVLLPNPCADSVPCKQYYSSDCVKFNGTLTCGSLGANPSLTSVLSVFCAGFINIGTEITNINITLGDILTEITTINEEILAISGSVCPSGWTDLPLFSSGVTIPNPEAKPQYRVNSCGDVELRGQIVQTVTLASPSPGMVPLIWLNILTGGGPIAIMAPGLRPGNAVYSIPLQIQVNGSISSTYYDTVASSIIVGASGEVGFEVHTVDGAFFNPGEDLAIGVSLDSIRYSTLP